MNNMMRIHAFEETCSKSCTFVFSETPDTSFCQKIEILSSKENAPCNDNFFKKTLIFVYRACIVL